MKHVKFFMLGVLLTLFYACSDTPLIEEVALTKAQNYFEQNATDLAPVHFLESKYRKLSRAAAPPTPELTPAWEFATTTEENGKEIVEAPVYSSIKFICGEEIVKDHKFQEFRKTTGYRRLVVVSDDNDSTGMYLLTLIPDSNYTSNLDENPYDFSFTGGCKFTGKVLVSSLEGELIEAWEYKDNKKMPLTVLPGINYAVAFWEEAPFDHTTIYVENAALVQAQSYSDNESGGGYIPGSGGGYIPGSGGGYIPGSGGGGNTGGGGGGSYTPGVPGYWYDNGSSGYWNEYGENDYSHIVSDYEAYKLGLQAQEQMLRDLNNRNVIFQQMIPVPGSTRFYFEEGINITSNIYSAYEAIMEWNLKLGTGDLINFGKGIACMGTYFSAMKSIAIIIEGNYSASNIMHLIATGLSILSMTVFSAIPLGMVLGGASLLFGLASTLLASNSTRILQLPMENGKSIYIYIPACRTNYVMA